MTQADSSITPVILNEEFRSVLDCLENSNLSIFVTGRAGTGKSTLLNLFRRTTRKKVVFLAPTGVAALNIHGQTIHSFFSIPPHLTESSQITRIRNRNLISKVDIIVIDEISMVRADIIDHIDHILKKVKKSKQLFGGVQIVFFGDLFQLPPIVSGQFEKNYFREYYESPYFFSAKCLEGTLHTFEMVELGKVFRQSDQYFIDVLDKVRTNTIHDRHLQEINDLISQNEGIREGKIILTSINANANAINLKRLREINDKAVVYTGQLTGEFNRNNCPTDEFLTLKPGAQVMFLRNDAAKKYVNGSIGIVRQLNKDSVIVRLEKTSEEIEVGYVVWEMIRYSFDKEKNNIQSEIAGTFSQLPLRLSWAITIHKSQGKTFENIHIDLGTGAFETGQCYVALSRCKSIEGISLQSKLRKSDIMADELITDFYNRYF